MNQDSAGSQRALVHEILDKRPLFRVGSPPPQRCGEEEKIGQDRAAPACSPTPRASSTRSVPSKSDDTRNQGPHVADGSSNLLLHRQHRQGNHRPRLPRSRRQDFSHEAYRQGRRRRGELPSRRHDHDRRPRVRGRPPEPRGHLRVPNTMAQHPRLRRQRPPAGQARLPVLGPPGAGHLQTTYVRRTGAKPKPA